MSTPGSTLGHGRHGSAGRGAPQMPRRPTRGPLDLADAPVSDPLSPTTPATIPLPATPGISQHTLNSPLIPTTGLMSPSPRPGSRATSPIPPTKAFPHLLQPELYHALPSTGTPPALLSSPGQTSDLTTLLSNSQFRSAAILAAQELTTTQPTDHARIFALLYVRLACLTLIGHTAMAAQEVKVLEDLGAEKYYEGEKDVARNVVPWELRVLAVRLQGIGFGDLRKGVMGYYDLVREARTGLTRLNSDGEWNMEHRVEERRMWQDRMQDLGIRVGGALVEMGDLEGAAVHLSTLATSSPTASRLQEAAEDGADSRAAAFRLALLWLKIGDVDHARAIIKNASYQSGEEEFVILALADMAEGKYQAASEVWRGLTERVDRERKWTGEEMWRVNLGVCLLYCGRIGEARQLMEGIVEKGNAFSALTFNLSTIYELSTDRSRVLKSQLVDKVAALSIEGKSGWEGSNADFKL